MLIGEEEVAVTESSNGGELGRRSGGRGQELQALHVPASTFVDKEWHV
jgi:hypothetical protein